MISKQHFIRAADIVNNIRQGNWTSDLPSWSIGLRGITEIDDRLRATHTAEAFITLFSEWNPRFDTQRFLVACGLVDAPVKARKGKVANV